MVTEDTSLAESVMFSTGSDDDSRLQNEVRDEKGVKYADRVPSETLCDLCVTGRAGAALNSVVTVNVGSDCGSDATKLRRFSIT